MNVIPTSRCRAARSAWRYLRSLASSAPSGSSRSSTDGASTRARARATRCCCPPESCAGRRRSSPSRRTSSIASRTRRRPFRLVDAPAPAQPVGDVVLHGQVGEQGVRLEDRVHRAAMRRDVHEVAAVEQDVAVGRLFEAGDQPQGGGLAATRRTEQREELAGLDAQVDTVHRGDVGELLAQPDQLDTPAVRGARLVVIVPAMPHRVRIAGPSLAPLARTGYSRTDSVESRKRQGLITSQP